MKLSKMSDEMLVFSIVDRVAWSVDREYKINHFRLNSAHFNNSVNSANITPPPKKINGVHYKEHFQNLKDCIHIQKYVEHLGIPSQKPFHNFCIVQCLFKIC